MRVGEDYSVNFFGWNWSVLPVAFAPFLLALEQPTINEDLEAALFIGI